MTSAIYIFQVKYNKKIKFVFN